MDFWYRVRFPLMGLGMLALLSGIWAGLLRLGWEFPLIIEEIPQIHGALMVCGFIGTVIGLERAVALNRPWGYSAPLLAAVGGIAMLAGRVESAGIFFITASSLVLSAIYVVMLKKQLTLFNAVMFLGALSWCAGNFLWLSGMLFNEFVVFWLFFLVLTIAGERLELSRMTRPSSQVVYIFCATIAVSIAGLCLVLLDRETGLRLAGAGITGISLWLARYDIARITIRQSGLTRFVAMALLLGYFWLFAGGIMLLASGELEAGYHYDAVLHSLFLGFTFSMIFGHAPIIFPAVLKVAVPYSGAFYIHLALLHFSLALRVAGDLASSDAMWMVGGLLNALALVAFLLNTVTSVVKGKFAAG